MNDRYREVAPLVLRLFVAFVLIYGTADNVFDQARMLEFRDFVAKHRFPWPMLSARVSAYGQFLAGILLALGLFTRWTSIVVILNFIAALAMVHIGLPFNANIAPLAMLVGGLFFAIYGAPAYSLDAMRKKRQRSSSTYDDHGQ